MCTRFKLLSVDMGKAWDTDQSAFAAGYVVLLPESLPQTAAQIAQLCSVVRNAATLLHPTSWRPAEPVPIRCGYSHHIWGKLPERNTSEVRDGPGGARDSGPRSKGHVSLPLMSPSLVLLHFISFDLVASDCPQVAPLQAPEDSVIYRPRIISEH